MRCYICDTELTDNEIQLDEAGEAEPCTTCLRIIMDTAYCDGFEPYPDEEQAEPVMEDDVVEENA